MFYEPKLGNPLPHSPFKAIVAPRPIGWISTIDTKGAINLAPYSFFNGVSAEPPLVSFCSDRIKHSAANAIVTGEFVVNLATRPMAEAMNKTSAAVAEDINEFDLAGIDPVPSNLVKPPRIKGVPAALECRVTQHVELTDAEGENISSLMVIGEIVGIYIDDAYITEGRFDVVKAQTISRLGYFDYAQVTELFELRRPKA